MLHYDEQKEAAVTGSFYLEMAFSFLEGRNIPMFFMFYGLAKGIFTKYNIELVMKP